MRRLTFLEKAGQLATAVTMKASNVSGAVSEKAGKLGERAGKIRVKTAGRARRPTWIATLGATALLLALAFSVGKRYFREE